MESNFGVFVSPRNVLLKVLCRSLRPCVSRCRKFSEFGVTKFLIDNTGCISEYATFARLLYLMFVTQNIVFGHLGCRLLGF